MPNSSTCPLGDDCASSEELSEIWNVAHEEQAEEQAYIENYGCYAIVTGMCVDEDGYYIPNPINDEFVDTVLDGYEMFFAAVTIWYFGPISPTFRAAIRNGLINVAIESSAVHLTGGDYSWDQAKMTGGMNILYGAYGGYITSSFGVDTPMKLLLNMFAQSGAQFAGNSILRKTQGRSTTLYDAVTDIGGGIMNGVIQHGYSGNPYIGAHDAEIYNAIFVNIPYFGDQPELDSITIFSAP